MWKLILTAVRAASSDPRVQAWVRDKAKSIIAKIHKRAAERADAIATVANVDPRGI